MPVMSGCVDPLFPATQAVTASARFDPAPTVYEKVSVGTVPVPPSQGAEPPSQWIAAEVTVSSVTEPPPAAARPRRGMTINCPVAMQGSQRIAHAKRIASARITSPSAA